MRTDAFITVTCDRCGRYDEEIRLTAVAGGAYDDRNVDGDLTRMEWRVEGGADICPDCVETEEAA